jgi:plasmid stability protein
VAAGGAGIDGIACNGDIRAISMAAGAEMATLTVRNVDPLLKERLRVRAATHGRSMEAELRCILRETLFVETGAQPDLATAIHRRFAALGGVELEPHPPAAIREPPDLGADLG